MNVNEIPEKAAGDYLYHAEINALVAAVKAMHPKEYTVPYNLIDGVADADGVITGTKIFDMPADIDITKPVLVYNNGIKVAAIVELVVDQNRMTLPEAPLGDGTQDGSSVVSVIYYPVIQ